MGKLPGAENEHPESVHVPGATTLWKTQNIPDLEIDLPVEAHGIFSLSILLMFLICIVYLFSVERYSGLAVSHFANSEFMIAAGFLSLVLFFLLLFILFVWVLTTMIRDVVTDGPLLILDREGLQDRRQLSAMVPWTNVESISFASGRISVLAFLKLRQPIYVKSGSFRLGGSFKRGMKSDVTVLISLLDQDTLKIGKVMLALVKANGGKLEGPNLFL
jgi:hypothetical protein